MLDYYIDNKGKFPDSKYFKKIGHDLSHIYAESMNIVQKRSISLKFLKNLDGAIHQNILTIPSDFACGDRYSNINILGGAIRGSDPIALHQDAQDVGHNLILIANFQYKRLNAFSICLCAKTQPIRPIHSARQPHRHRCDRAVR